MHVTPPFVNRGVTVMVAVIGAVLVFTAVNDEMLPVPLAANPMDGVLLLHVKTVPATEPLKLIEVVTDPLQRV